MKCKHYPVFWNIVLNISLLIEGMSVALFSVPSKPEDIALSLSVLIRC